MSGRSHGPRRSPSGGSRELRLATLAGAALLALALVTAGLRAVRLGRQGLHALAAPGHALADADLDPLAAYVSTAALARAARTLPPGASYALVVGLAHGAAAGRPLSPSDPGQVVTAFRLWLLPRRYTSSLADASWVIVYDSPVPPRLAVRRRVALGPDAVALELAAP